MGRNSRMGTSKLQGIDFHQVELWQKRFEKAGVSWKPFIESGLEKSHSYITGNLEKHSQKSFYPAHGKFSSGGTNAAIHRDSKIIWLNDNFATIRVGFDHSKTVAPLLLMYGTPKMRPVTELYDDIFGRKTRSEIRHLQLDDIEQWWGDFNSQ